MNTQNPARILRASARTIIMSATLNLGLSAFASTDYGPAHWRPACDDFFSGGNGKRFFVIHDMEGYYAYCVSASGILRRCSGSVVTVHYCVNGKKDTSTDYPAGEVSQLVRDSYYAWHARCWSSYSMGTEHEGFASNPAWYTEAQYVASASLTKSKCNKYNIAKDRNHVIAHGQKSRSSWRTWASAAGYSSTWINCNTHSDPGPYWNWTHYMNLVKDTIAPPTAPSSPVATTYSATQINLSWTDNSSTESGFKIERSTSSGGTYTQIGTTGANIKTFASTGLASGTKYYYRIRAYNAGGNSGYTAVVSATTKDTIPAAPTALTATAVSSTQINLAWAQAMPNEDGFRVYSSSDNVTYTLIATVGINAVSYSNTNLLGNRLYYYKVAAYNTAGNSAFSNTASDTTAPEAPSGLVVNSIPGMANWNKLDLTWTDNSSSEVGFKVERATAVGGPYTQIVATGDGETTYQDSGLAALTTYYYRVRSFNANGNSVYSAVASRATGAAPPVLAAIGNKTVAVAAPLTFTATSSNPNQLVTTNTWQTFQSFPHNTPNETILFKKPSNSTTTSGFLDTTATNYTCVVTTGPTAWGSGNKVLKANWNFKTGFSELWLRLHSGGVATNPNPTIALDQKVQFKAYSAHTLRFTLGVRETGTAAAYGADGGTTGAIEWVGATSVVNGVPMGGHSAPINTPVEMSFNIPFESHLPFTGDGIIDQTGSKGVLEHIGIQGTSAGADGLNYVYFDDFAVVTTNTLAYTLDAGAPAGASIGYRSGKFSWTPSAGQVGLHTVTVRVTDRLGGQDWETFKVTVTGSGNAAPVLQAIGNKTVNEGGTVSFTVRATDADAGMVSWWPGEGNASDLNNLANGTMSGGAYFSPGKASAFKFDGVDDYVQVGSSTSLKMTSAMTFGAWIYPTTTPATAAILVNREGEYEIMRLNDQTIGWAFANTTPGWLSVSSGYVAPTNRWTHVAVTYASGVIKTYANGTLVHTYNGTGSIGDVDAAKNDFRIAGRQAGGNWFPGLIDETTIYNRELSAAEIQSLSNPNLNHTTVGLVSRWESDNTANDLKGINNGTMVGGATYAAVTKTGRAFTFEGENDYVQMGAASALVMSNVMSFDTWIYPTGPGSGANGGGGILINKEAEYEMARYADGTIRYAIANTSPGWNWTNTGFVAPLNTWTHLVMTYSNGIVKTYGNGTLVSTINGTGAIGDIDTASNDFRIGGRQTGDQFFQGFIDEPTIYRRVLSATEVSALYNGQTKSFGTFSLDAGNPSGSSINSSSGVFSWTPGESHGPGSYPIAVRITDGGSPASNDVEIITVTVNELNVAPVLAAIANQTINEGATLNVTAVATDADLPANTLTYSLIGPVGMTINPGNGAISYTPGETEGGQVHQVTVTVKDNGNPMFSNTKTFTVTINEANTAPVITIGALNDYNPFATFDELDDESIDGYNDACLFRVPEYSVTTSAFLETNSAAFITNSFPQDEVNSSYQCLFVNMNFKTGTVNPWCRLSTHTDETWTNRYAYPNPTIDLGQHVRCKIWSDKSIKVAIGVRETGTLNPLGFDGGTTGTIEWVGATSSGGTPVPTRTITASNWTQLDFNLPAEVIAAFDGNGVLASGRGTLEELIIVPNGGMGNYNIYLDDFETLSVKTSPITIDTGDILTFTCSSTDSDLPAQDRSYSLGAGAPANATIDDTSGFFSWAVAPEDSGTNVVTLIVTDTGSPQLSGSQNITVIVNTVNTPPRLNSINDLVVENGSGGSFTFDAFAEDDDLPEQTLTYSMSGAPAGATLNPSTGAFSWTPSAGLSTNTVKIRATDNGLPALWDEQTVTMRVVPTNNPPVLSLGTARITETIVNFETFAPTAANGTVMFRRPTNSSATLSFIDTAVTNYTLVVTNGPSAWNPGTGNKSLKASWSFKTGTANYWVRLQTSNTTSIPNPTINASAKLKFDVYSDKAIKVGLGVRETGTSAENGANGGTTGVLEYVGCTNMTGATPLPFRSVTPLIATNFEFDLPTEPMRTLDGNSILAAGQQVLESIIIVGAGGTGVYQVYFDNFQIVTTTALPSPVTMKANSTLQFTASASDPNPGAGVTFGLDADFSEAHTNALIHPVTGAFTWTPGTADIGTTNIPVIADDEPTDGGVPKSDSETFTVVVTSDTLGALGSDGNFIAGGDTVTLAWDSVAGQAYKVQLRAKESSNWADIQTVTASGAKSSVAVFNNGTDGYTRVVTADGSSDQ